MILYFADRHFNIIGTASTALPNGLTIADDLKTEDVETGVAVFDCTIPFDRRTRTLVESCCTVGNYLLRSNGEDKELFTIIDCEIDTKEQKAVIYAEDAGMDLLNDVVGKYEADTAYPITHYIDKYAAGAGFEVGINEVADLYRQLSFTDKVTATERIAQVAAGFDGCEISFDFDVEGLTVVRKYIHIYKKRGKDIGATFRLNMDTDGIVTSTTISNLATALECEGGTPDDSESSVTLFGYQYDDGDFYIDGTVLKSRKALETWDRFFWKDSTKQQSGGHITRRFSSEAVTQTELLYEAIEQLKKLREVEVNYEIQISNLPGNVKIGDRVNVVDDTGGLYLSTRLLKTEESVTNQKQSVTLGEFLIKGSGISQKVVDLAEQFAKTAVSATRALSIANSAKANAANAQAQAGSAADSAQAAQEAAEAALNAANSASESASAAQEKVTEAQQSVDRVEESVKGIETTVTNAQQAAQQAQQAAQTAETKASEAQQAAVNAQAAADLSATSAGNAQTAANTATEKADTAKTAAEKAVKDAAAAATTAQAAKLDAENAKKDIADFAEGLTALENTMSAEYARKTDLTETEAHLQSQITQNAAGISSTAKKVQRIDETTNDAHKLLQGALAWAEKAQEEADQATAEAEEAQAAADEAAQAAIDAQAEADIAMSAADTAQSVLNDAQAALDVAIADLETIQSRADATEEEIATAQKAVEAARQAANSARAESIAASGTAAEAQAKADAAVLEANTAQEVANTAASKVALAQAVADEAEVNAEAAKAAADEAAEQAAEAQRTAQAAAEQAQTAQDAANDAAKQSAAAEQAATDAQAKVEQAAVDLSAAQERLADVMSNVDATEEEVAAAQSAVNVAQIAVDAAQEEADSAQAAADTARENATEARNAANEAQNAANEAQSAANEAQSAAYKAQGEVYGLAVRVENAETQIIQNAEQIALRATKKEVADTLGGYSTKEETAAAIEVKADEITSSVSKTIEGLEIGARNLIRNSVNLIFEDYYFASESDSLVAVDDGNGNITLDSSTLTAIDDGNGNITLDSPSIVAVDDGNGNITLS